MRPDRLSIFTRSEAAALKGRCLDCGCHIATQGHKAECRTRAAEKNTEATQ